MEVAYEDTPTPQRRARSSSVKYIYNLPATQLGLSMRDSGRVLARANPIIAIYIETYVYMCMYIFIYAYSYAYPSVG